LKPDPEQDWRLKLYENRAAQLILYGRALGLDHAEAEDALHDTFVALFKLRMEPEEPERYALRAIRHRALNYRRSLWRRVRREFESHQWFQASEPQPDAEHTAIEQLTLLPAEQREVIVLKLWHQLTFEEIGDLLKTSPNTVAARFRYGIRKIRKHMETMNYDEIRSFGDDHDFLETARTIAQS
jgi:RNA polymerase sigma-70 factor (ECF subfamily)